MSGLVANLRTPNEVVQWSGKGGLFEQAADEIERLQSIVEIVEFLQRPDIQVGYYRVGAHPQPGRRYMVVYHKDHAFEGSGPNVISAAYEARALERMQGAENKEKWVDDLRLDEFDQEDGITREEIIANVKDAHYGGQCEPMSCPICTDQAAEAKEK